jgi:transcriptional regulator with XRE-family HTH domain
MDTLRENIRKKMIEKGLNPYTLSEKSEVPQPTIQRFLSGKHGDPRSSTIQKLAKGLDATEAELRGFDNVLDSRIKTINELMSKLSSEQISSLELIIKSMVNPKHNSKNPPEPEKTQLTNAMEGRLTLAHEPDSETYERMANKK